MKKYYLHNGSENVGPFDLEELKQKKITRETPVWFEGISDWTTAGKIEELKTIFQSMPPPIKKEKPPVYKKSKGLNIIQKIALVILLFIVGR